MKIKLAAVDLRGIFRAPLSKTHSHVALQIPCCTAMVLRNGPQIAR